MKGGETAGSYVEVEGQGEDDHDEEGGGEGKEEDLREHSFCLNVLL